MDWRLIDEGVGPAPPARSGAGNMAVDTALLDSVKAGAQPVLRFYRWTRPCLSLGRNQPAGSLRAEAGKADAPFDMVRRPTGGLAVYHARELTYAAALPVRLLGSPRETYFALNRALIAGLQALGVRAEAAGWPTAAGGAPLGRLDGGPCFRAASPGEVVVAGRKLIGSAQRRDGPALLQHGSLLLEGDQSELLELLGLSGAGPADDAVVVFTQRGAGVPPATGAALPPPTIALADVLGSIPPWPTLIGSLRQGFEETLGTRFAPGGLSVEEQVRAAALEPHYRSPEWTWRR